MVRDVQPCCLHLRADPEQPHSLEDHKKGRHDAHDPCKYDDDVHQVRRKQAAIAAHDEPIVAQLHGKRENGEGLAG